MVAKNLALIAVFSPLLGFLLSTPLSLINAGFEHPKERDLFAQWITCALMGVACLASFFLFKDICLSHNAQTLSLFSWIEMGDFKASWGFKLDSISVLMMSMVTFISLLIHIYSVGYMSHDASIPRFMGYLSLFTFMMLTLVTAPNLLQLFFGWEGVGLASYLLIGFWYDRPAANRASIKAFLVNRVGDVGLALGIAATFMIFNTIEFDDLFAQLLPYTSGSTSGVVSIEYISRPIFTVWSGQWDALTVIGILFIIGAMGKSAQLGLHTWLPDAMEGPTPVSALIHAATMVTAGVFLLCRLSPLYELVPLARDILIIVGASTALFAATIAITQTDIKRVIAYSTCSQLGYMMFAVGCSAYNAALYHLIAHAFFKALLFLGAGSVIHALSDEQNMNRMGGIYRFIPVTYAVMWIGSLQLAAIPVFSFYQSKDTIIEFAFLQGTFAGNFAFYIGVFVAFLTALYSWRLLLLTFHGPIHADDKVMASIHESPLSMLIPLGLLSLGTILSGYFGYVWFMGDYAVSFWNGSLILPHHHGEVPLWVVCAPVVSALLGIFVAYILYGGLYEKFYGELKGEPSPSDQLAHRFKRLYAFSYNKWYIDELYDYLFVKGAFTRGEDLKKNDQGIDYIGPDGLSSLSVRISKFMVQLQTGYVYHYAFAMIIGILFMMNMCVHQYWMTFRSMALYGLVALLLLFGMTIFGSILLVNGIAYIEQKWRKNHAE